MLEQKDLDALSIMMQNIVKNSEIAILKQVDEKFVRFEERMMKQVDDKITKSEVFVLDEIERTRNVLEKRLDKLQQNLDELNQYYRIIKLEDNNIELLLKMNDELSKRVEKLEKKTA